MVTLVVLQVDFGPMAKHEANAQKGDLFTTGDRPYAEAKQDVIKGKGESYRPSISYSYTHNKLHHRNDIHRRLFLTEQASLMRLQAAMLQSVLCLEAFLR